MNENIFKLAAQFEQITKDIDDPEEETFEENEENFEEPNEPSEAEELEEELEPDDDLVDASETPTTTYTAPSEKSNFWDDLKSSLNKQTSGVSRYQTNKDPDFNQSVQQEAKAIESISKLINIFYKFSQEKEEEGFDPLADNSNLTDKDLPPTNPLPPEKEIPSNEPKTYLAPKNPTPNTEDVEDIPSPSTSFEEEDD